MMIYFELPRLKEYKWRMKVMARYKVLIHYSDGSSEEEDKIFTSITDAEEYGSYMCSCCSEGAEIMELSNPGDYPLEDAASAEYEVIKIND